MELAENFAMDRYKFAEEQIGCLSGSGEQRVIFDIGPGDGRMRNCVGPSDRWLGFDRQPWHDVVAWNLDGPCPLPDVRADMVLFLDVIEHLPNPGTALRHIAAAMKDGAVIVVTTPNPRWSGSRLNVLARGEVSGFSPSDIASNYHVLPIWPHVLEAFMLEAKLIPQRYVTLGGQTRFLEAKGKMKGPPRYALNLLQMAIEAMDTTARGDSYAMVAVKCDAHEGAVAYAA